MLAAALFDAAPNSHAPISLARYSVTALFDRVSARSPPNLPLNMLRSSAQIWTDCDGQNWWHCDCCMGRVLSQSFRLSKKVTMSSVNTLTLQSLATHIGMYGRHLCLVLSCMSHGVRGCTACRPLGDYVMSLVCCCETAILT